MKPSSTAAGEPWSPAEALALWQYFGGVGAADKNTMVSVETWLLGLLATSLGYATTQLLCFRPLSVTEPYEGVCLAILGVVISVVAAYVALLYGGYSTWNWAKADAIAADQASHERPERWKELLPDFRVERRGTTGRGWHWATAWRFGQPCDDTRLAPIFAVYTYLAIIAGLAHTALLGLSLSSLPGYSIRPLVVVGAGLGLISLCLLLGRMRHGKDLRGLATAATWFASLWVIGGVLNAWYGTTHGGLSIFGEGCIFVAVFVVPAAASWVVRRLLCPR